VGPSLNNEGLLYRIENLRRPGRPVAPTVFKTTKRGRHSTWNFWLVGLFRHSTKTKRYYVMKHSYCCKPDIHLFECYITYSVTWHCNTAFSNATPTAALIIYVLL